MSVALNEGGKSTLGKIAGAAIAGTVAGTVGFVGGLAAKGSKVIARQTIGGAASRALYDDSKIMKRLAKMGTVGNVGVAGLKKISNAKFGTGKSFGEAAKDSENKIRELKALREKALGDDGVAKLKAHEDLYNTKVIGFDETEKGKQLEKETKEKEEKELKKRYKEDREEFKDENDQLTAEGRANKEKNEKAKALNEQLFDIEKQIEGENKNFESLLLKQNAGVKQASIEKEKAEKELERIKKDPTSTNADIQAAESIIQQKTQEFENAKQIAISSDSKIRDAKRKHDQRVNDLNNKKNKNIQYGNTNGVEELNDEERQRNAEMVRKNAYGNNLKNTVLGEKNLGILGQVFTDAATARDVMYQQEKTRTAEEEKAYERRKKSTEKIEEITNTSQGAIRNLKVKRQKKKDEAKEELDNKIQNNPEITQLKSEIEGLRTKEDDLYEKVLKGDINDMENDIQNLGVQLSSSDAARVNALKNKISDGEKSKNEIKNAKDNLATLISNSTLGKNKSQEAKDKLKTLIKNNASESEINEAKDEVKR